MSFCIHGSLLEPDKQLFKCLMHCILRIWFYLAFLFCLKGTLDRFL